MLALKNEETQTKTPIDGNTMTELLVLFGCGLQCADPRDRVYSLLALLSHAEQARLAITPDYSKWTWDLFTYITRLF
jgi:hypothetical protein